MRCADRTGGINLKKSILAVLCCSVIILSSGCGIQVTPQASTQDSAGPVLETTTVDNEEYYVLTTEEDLQAIGKQYPLSGNYILDNDITLSDEWTPIGSPDEPFTGIFDGNGYIIDNLTVTKKTDDMGFFGAAKDAVIKDVILENANIDVLSFFPIVHDAEDTEIIGCSINDGSGTQSNSQESTPFVYSFDDEEEMIGQLIAAGYQNMSLSDFRTLTLDVFNDTNTLDSVLNDLEDYFKDGSTEARIVAYSLPATYSELLSDNNSGTFTDNVEKERTAGRTIMDTIEFHCNIEYALSYVVSDESLTVSERDNVLENIHDQMQEYVDNANEEFLASAEAGSMIEEQLQSIINENLIEGMSVSGTLTDVSILDDNGEYQTIFPE